MTHVYVSDTLELNPHDFQVHGAPQDPEAFMAWIVERAQDLLAHQALSLITGSAPKVRVF